jgi:hypothetical protein
VTIIVRYNDRAIAWRCECGAHSTRHLIHDALASEALVHHKECEPGKIIRLGVKWEGGDAEEGATPEERGPHPSCR